MKDEPSIFNIGSEFSTKELLIGLGISSFLFALSFLGEAFAAWKSPAVVCKDIGELEPGMPAASADELFEAFKNPPKTGTCWRQKAGPSTLF